jgi:hypothetical protein
MHRSHFQMPRVGGRKQPLHGNVQARPFDNPPRRLTLNTMHMMSQFCYNRSFDVLRKTTDRMITADTNNFAITQEKVRVTCFECGAGYRRIELNSRPVTKGEFHCLVCDNLLETFDGSRQVALRLTGSRENIRKFLVGPWDVADRHIAKFFCNARLGRYRGVADIEQASPRSLWLKLPTSA